MSPSGAVYQPTTVTYEANASPQERWSDRPISYLTSFTRTSGAGAICAVIGLILLINGAIFYSDPQTIGEGFYLTCTILGALIFCVGVFLFGMFLRQSRRLCCRTGKDPLDPVTGQALTVNPSTDLLVAAQYAPVSEVAYQPPSEDTEQSKLMPQEHKDEDTDRMIERDPRIVLSPLNPTTHEDT
ncbi:uncharacterized protein LOC116179104 isoform X2 [Photinus pyralis]|uniref:uncharacterized protein LOC116161451 isoform X2 n=1 Tax=Photinus pyralis TaxID=7054 RepID=UPI0012678377|nr:uncharacterized protein LOC116161451 isoform X2 [Photinus pyralis]XP_031354676.1 uncharacterized protein LOC116179104 isoform X2 [Photinus pyralis]